MAILPHKDPLTMTALSVLGDLPPHPNQPKLDDGIHLRWFPGPYRGFPLKGGYYLFRRRIGGRATTSTCMRSFLTKTPIQDIITKRQLPTPVGTISRPTGDPLPVVPFEPDPINDKAFLLGSIDVLRLMLPLGVIAEGVQARFRMRLPAGSQSGTVIVNGFLHGQPAFTKSAVGKNQEDIVIAVDTGKFDRLDFPQAPAVLYEICTGTPSASTATCLIPFLKEHSDLLLLPFTNRFFDTAMGTLMEGTGGDLNGVPVGPPGVVGFRIAVLQFYLPSGKTADQFTVTLRFPALAANAALAPTPKAAPAAALAAPPGSQVRIDGKLGNTIVFTKIVTVPLPQDVTVTSDPALVDNILISNLSDPPAILLDLCYVPTTVFTVAPPSPTTPAFAAAQASAVSFPGSGWEVIPNLTSVIKLPLIHPLYPASPGPESINASTAIAKSRVHYGAWGVSFKASARTPGPGTVTLTNGSAIVTGSGVNWNFSLIGNLICLPSGGADYTAYAVMSVLAPDRAVLSRSYSGANVSNVPYDLVQGDDFAELHDRIACLLQSPDNMRAATSPPALDQGTVAGAKFVLAFGGISTVAGIGTQWTSNLAGCHIEIGPTWFHGKTLGERNVYRILSVKSTPQQITLDRPFTGRSSAITPFAKGDYRIFARTGEVNQDPSGPALEFKPMDMIELATLVPSYAQAVGLFWIDTSVAPGDEFDYIVLADHQNRFSQQVANALSWLNANPLTDFSGDVDGYVTLDVKHLGSAALQPPSQIELYRLPGWGARTTIAHPDRADSDVGICVKDAASWADANTPQPAPIMLNLWRHGPDTTKPPSPATLAYLDLERVIPWLRSPIKGLKLPPGWPPDPARVIHFIDSDSDGTGLDVGWYSYLANSIDIFGRWSAYSNPIPWIDVTEPNPGQFTVTNHGDSVHLQDLVAPPPPAGVLAWMLDDRDPYVLRDDAFNAWQKAWRDKPGVPPPIGLRVKWRCPWAHQNQGPDLEEFRIYLQSTPLNARPGRVTAVAPGQLTQSVVALQLDATDTTVTDPNNIYKDVYKDASLQAGNRSFPILASQGNATVQLTVQNGGAKKNEPPDSKVDGAIVIPTTPVRHPLAKELLDPKNWKDWLAAVPQNLAGTQYDVEMVENPSVTTFDSDDNKLVGIQATWNGSAFVLDLPTGLDLAAVRPGIDVLALAANKSYFAVQIHSVQSGNQVVPAQIPNPAPDVTIKYEWRLGPPNPGLHGFAGQWNAASRRLSLDGKPNLSNVNPGADFVYVATTGASPADLNSFLAVDAVDSANHTVTLSVTPAQLSTLTTGLLEWKIGRPVRYYEVFLPDPVLTPNLDVSALLRPTLTHPVVHGTIGVSSADRRTDVADQRPGRTRTGNESFLSGPAPVFRVLRDPFPQPIYAWNVTRLYATKADYKANSFFTVRWSNQGPGYFAHILRAMDSSLFLAHWNRTDPIVLPATGLPPAVRASLTDFLATFKTHKDRFTAFMAAAKSAPDSTFAKVETARAQDEYRAAGALYSQLDDASLWWLAGQPELSDAYMQVTIKLLDLSDPANGDRQGPDDDPTTFHANPTTVCAYVDTLPGRSTNRYFYRVMLLDGAQNRSPLGDPTPPVYLPKVVPPRTPVITKVLGGELQITIRWAHNREPDLAGYRVYRTDDTERAKDLRSMEVAATIRQADIDLSAPNAEWVDNTNLVGGRKYYYRLTATDTFGNESQPTQVQIGIPVDTREPRPEWTEQTWLLHRKSYDTFIDWPADGIVPTGYEPVLRLDWQCDIPAPQFVLRRMREPETTWRQPNNIVNQPGSSGSLSFILYDYDADPTLAVAYRLKVRSPSGVWSADDALLVVSLPGSGGQ